MLFAIINYVFTKSPVFAFVVCLVICLWFCECCVLMCCVAIHVLFNIVL